MEIAMKGRAVGATQWTALRELREGEPPTFSRLAAAAELHSATIRERALRDNWEKQPYRRSGTPATAPIEIELPDEDVSLEEVRRRLATSTPRQLARLAALAEHGRIGKSDIDALNAWERLLERTEALAADEAKELQKRSDDELAGMLQLIDDRIVELAEEHAGRLVRARDREGMD
jgi:hypothetical protein